jgi:hypothetical protein
MKKWLGCAGIAALLTTPGQAVAGELRLSIANGRVTIVAQDVTVKQILDEWGRVGQTTVVGADKLTGGPISIELHDVAEGRALESLLRSASGYIAKPRGGTPGASAYDRILIMPASRAPAVSAAPPPFANRPQPQVVVPPVDDDVEPNPILPPGVGQPPPPQQFPGQPPMQPGQQQPLTSPRPGQLPPPAPGMPGSPYQFTPGQQAPTRPPGPPGVPGAPGPGGSQTQPGGPGGPGGGQS